MHLKIRCSVLPVNLMFQNENGYLYGVYLKRKLNLTFSSR